MSEHIPSRACYQSGCRELECRVANAAYMVVYRTKLMKGEPVLGRVQNGHQVAVMLRQLLSEAFRPIDLIRATGLPPRTFYRHTQSSPVEQRTLFRVRRFWRQQQVDFDGTES